MTADRELRRCRNFVMLRSVHRTQHGRGARFQNHQVTCYKIKPLAPLPSRSIDEARRLANPDYVRISADPLQCYYQTWKFYTKEAADRAWVLLSLKYGS